MMLSEKIIALRKKAEWSQEELAERLQISRQSVSKWESGASVPDLTRVLQLAELFGVTTDYLLRDDPEADASFAAREEQAEEQAISAEEADAFLQTRYQSAVPIAAAVAACIFSPIPLLLLGALHEFQNRFSEQGVVAAGVGALLLIVGAAVVCFVFQGTKLERYHYLEKEAFHLAYGVEAIVRRRMEEYAGTRRIFLCVGIFLCIVCPVPLLCSTTDFQTACAVPLLLGMVGCGVFLLTVSAQKHEACQILLQEGDYTPQKKLARRRDHFPAIYWSLITALYLLISFLLDWKHGGSWEHTWVVWPVAGLLFGAIQAARRMLRGEDVSD